MEPFQAVLELNAAVNGGAASQCGEAVFTAATCAFGGGGSTLKCK
jgi:hypothetical protein